LGNKNHNIISAMQSAIKQNTLDQSYWWRNTVWFVYCRNDI